MYMGLQTNFGQSDQGRREASLVGGGGPCWQGADYKFTLLKNNYLKFSSC